MKHFYLFNRHPTIEPLFYLLGDYWHFKFEKFVEEDFSSNFNPHIHLGPSSVIQVSIFEERSLSGQASPFETIFVLF